MMAVMPISRNTPRCAEGDVCVVILREPGRETEESYPCGLAPERQVNPHLRFFDFARLRRPPLRMTEGGESSRIGFFPAAAGQNGNGRAGDEEIVKVSR